MLCDRKRRQRSRRQEITALRRSSESYRSGLISLGAVTWLIFIRSLYTAGTYVEALDAENVTEHFHLGSIVCLTEVSLGGKGSDEKVTIGLVAAQPKTGEVIYDRELWYQQIGPRADVERQNSKMASSAQSWKLDYYIYNQQKSSFKDRLVPRRGRC